MKLLHSLVLVAALAAGALLGTGAPVAASPPSAYGCDYSFSRPTLATLDHPGQGPGIWCRFVVRYLNGGGKGLSASETRFLHANGRDLVLNWEGTGQEVWGGYAAGVADAHAAAAWRASIGAPASVPVIFSVDFDLNRPGLVAAWLGGAASVLGRAQVGVYGGYRVVQAACAAGFAGRNWQTYAWSAGRWASPSCAPLRQVRNDVASGQLDLDEQVGAYPMWGPNGPVAVPAPAPAPVSARPVRHTVRHTAVRVRRAVAHRPAPRIASVYVTVRRGDTVRGIARRYHTSVSRVASLNRLRNANRVYAGQRLRVR